jgi:hypothetical protein
MLLPQQLTHVCRIGLLSLPYPKLMPHQSALAYLLNKYEKMKGWKYEIINNFAVSEERKKRCFTHEKW